MSLCESIICLVYIKLLLRVADAVVIVILSVLFPHFPFSKCQKRATNNAAAEELAVLRWGLCCYVRSSSRGNVGLACGCSAARGNPPGRCRIFYLLREHRLCKGDRENGNKSRRVRPTLGKPSTLVRQKDLRRDTRGRERSPGLLTQNLIIVVVLMLRRY